MMREMRILAGEEPMQKPSLYDQLENEGEKTKADGSPITMIDLLYDKRYAEREHDSEYYESDYYFSEEDSESDLGDGGGEDDEEEEEEESEEELEESKTDTAEPTLQQ